MVSYMNYLSDAIWRTRRLRFDNDAYTNLHHIHGNIKINGNKIKAQSFVNMFFIHFNKQNVEVLGWPLKLLQSPYSKVCLTSTLPLRPNGRIFLAFNVPSQVFLWESRKATAWWEHWNQMGVSKSSAGCIWYLLILIYWYFFQHKIHTNAQIWCHQSWDNLCMFKNYFNINYACCRVTRFIYV